MADMLSMQTNNVRDDLVLEDPVGETGGSSCTKSHPHAAAMTASIIMFAPMGNGLLSLSYDVPYLASLAENYVCVLWKLRDLPGSCKQGYQGQDPRTW